MINKKVILFLFGFNLFSPLVSASSSEDIELANNIDQINEEQNQETLLRFVLLNRIDNLAQVFDKHHEFTKLYSELLRKFMGIHYTSFNGNNIFRLEKIMEGLSILQARGSEDIKYFFDMSVKALLDFDCEILHKMSEGQVNQFISLAFFVSQLIPLNFSEEHEKFVEFSQNPYEWSQILLNFNQSFAELGIDRDGELYEEFQKTIVNPLEKSHTFKIYRACSERIYDRFNGTNCGDNEYEKTSYKKLKKTYNNLKNRIKSYKDDEINNSLDSFDEDFMKFYNHELLIRSSLLSLFNMDTLFNLMVIGRLGLSIPEALSEDIANMIKKYSLLARFILDELMSLSKAGSINWKKYEELILEDEDYEKIVFNLSLLNNLDELTPSSLTNRYQDEIENAMTGMEYEDSYNEDEYEDEEYISK